MHRRDFLRMRTAPDGRTLELSCRALHLRLVNAAFLAASSADEGVAEPGHEPPTLHDHASIDAIVREVDDQLKSVDIVRLIDGEWLASSDLRGRFDPLLVAFRARGGRVVR